MKELKDKINVGNKHEILKMKELISKMKRKIRDETTKRIIDWTESEDIIRSFSSAYTYNKYKAGEIKHEKALEKAFDKMAETMYKERDVKLEVLRELESMLIVLD